jgi:hypothetical protein
LGIGLTFFCSSPANHFMSHVPQPLAAVPFVNPVATTHQPDVAKNVIMSDTIRQVQSEILQNDLRGAAKTIKIARGAQGKNAEFASLTCQIKILLGKKKSAKKACYAALSSPFQNEDFAWKASTYDGLASLFESISDVNGAIQAARLALEFYDAGRKGMYYVRLIQLLAVRGTCDDLQEAQNIVITAAIPGPQLAQIQQGLFEWVHMKGALCPSANVGSYAHLPPGIRRLLLHPEDAAFTQTRDFITYPMHLHSPQATYPDAHSATESSPEHQESTLTFSAAEVLTPLELEQNILNGQSDNMTNVSATSPIAMEEPSCFPKPSQSQFTAVTPGSLL